MSSNLNLEQLISNTVLRELYQGGQVVKAAFSLAHKNISTQLRQTFFPTNIPVNPVSSEISQELEKRFKDLVSQDWQDAQEGVYPVSLLFDDNWLEFIISYINIWLDYPATWPRIQKQNYQELPTHINLDKYPQYYRRTFHYQSDGYLSDKSANVYDLQVDILFNGVADGMRRRILKPLKVGLNELKASTDAQRILDVACGTGRTLKFIRSSLPQVSLYGIDLSSAYLRKANQLLGQIPEELPQLIEGNAEHLPYADEYFQGVTNVFLLHELPNSVRQKVIDEFYRVLQSRGVVVIADSMQKSDSAQLQTLMENFP